MDLPADLHIHSLFSMASSKKMLPDDILAACALKGIMGIGTGDALHPQWRKYWEDTSCNEVIVVPTTEVEDENRVHHLILMPDMDSCETLAGLYAPFSKNLNTNGRPHIRLSGERIAEAVHETGGMIGPAHAFTPWTSLYASHDCLHACYQEETVDLLELGLSADSGYGSGISELHKIPFLSNSDAHSPHPAKIGREFSVLTVANRSVSAVLDAIRGGAVSWNAGFFPEEGKYNKTACIRCFQIYTLAESQKAGWRCRACGGRLKKGVSDRALELSDVPKIPRPPYLHIIPLYDITRRVLHACSPQTKKCTLLYNTLIDTLEDEIAILIKVPVDEIREVHTGVGDAIDALRSGRVVLHPGGGGKYGSFDLPL